MERWLDLRGEGASTDWRPEGSVDRVLVGSAVDEPPAEAWHAVDGVLHDGDGGRHGMIVSVDDAAGQQAALAAVGVTDWVLAECREWRMIPLENLVGAAAGSGTRVAALLTSASQLQGAAGALQLGVDAVVLAPEPDLWEAAEALGPAFNEAPAPSAPVEAAPAALQALEVVEVSPAGMGDRVCVDLTSLLEVGEGMLVGSASRCLLLVHGETLASEFVPARPFRVNAGAVHAYVEGVAGRRPYLSDLAAGDRVTVVASSGARREVTIGRLKVERRPLLLVRVKDATSDGQLFLQQAETVRLVGADHEPIAVTDLEPGQRILGVLGDAARHLGSAIPANAEER